jgi:hypothetical protein
MDRKTVLVIGAGASKEANLPVGSELKKLIANIIDITVDEFDRRANGDKIIYEALCLSARNDPSRSLTPFISACDRIHDAMPQAPSIDHFIDHHQANKYIALCGKMAIVRTILHAESASLLFTQGLGKMKLDRLEDKWFNSFMQQLLACRRSDLERRLSSIALVIFNYDRCVEHYLYHALQNYYEDVRAEEAASLLKNLDIYHPYGTVGALPWQTESSAPKGAIEFGATPGAQDLLALASQIKTFTEGTDESSGDIIAIRSAMDMARVVVFLGFAFHSLNLDLLQQPTKPPRAEVVNRSVFATALGISDNDTKLISEDLQHREIATVPARLYVRNVSCGELFREYERSLSQAVRS